MMILYNMSRSGWKPWIELVCLIRGVVIPEAMRKDFYFIRLRMASEDVIGFINDIFGISKDLVFAEVLLKREYETKTLITLIAFHIV